MHVTSSPARRCEGHKPDERPPPASLGLRLELCVVQRLLPSCHTRPAQDDLQYAKHEQAQAAGKLAEKEREAAMLTEQLQKYILAQKAACEQGGSGASSMSSASSKNRRSGGAFLSALGASGPGRNSPPGAA